MKLFDRVLALALLTSVSGVLLVGTCAAQSAKPPGTAPSPPAATRSLPSDTPAKFEPVTDAFDHVRRDVMIPMRDGVKLHTVDPRPPGARGRRSCSRARPTTRPS